MKITETNEEMNAHLDMEIHKTEVKILQLEEKMKELLELKNELNK